MVMAARARRAPAPAGAGGGERDLRRRHAAGRHPASRKGLTVEVDNTDAEGRLVLADALALADEEAPELIVEPRHADRRGAGGARARRCRRSSPTTTRSPPTSPPPPPRSPTRCGACRSGTPYEPLIEPGIADLDNAPSGGMAGAITAALFLRRFVTASPRYLHLDIYGWTPQAKPARPKGGAFQADARCSRFWRDDLLTA